MIGSRMDWKIGALPDKAELLKRVFPDRKKWGKRPPEVIPEPVVDGEESVWDYPRPPVVRDGRPGARVILDGREIAKSDRTLRIVETAGAPVYYFPPSDIDESILSLSEHRTICEWKGVAIYFDANLNNRKIENFAFSYPDPLDDLSLAYERIANWYGVYPKLADKCFIGNDLVKAQPGGVYAGWVTPEIKGPIKGALGTSHW